MSDQGNPKLIGSCRVDITGAATAVFLANSGAFATVVAAATIATLTVPAAGRQIDQVSDLFILTAEGTAFAVAVCRRLSATQIAIRLFDALGAVQQGECSIDWYTVARG